MVTVKDTSGNERKVPSMELFEHTQKRFQLAYLVSSLAIIIGLYFFQHQSVNSEIDKINAYATAQCKAQISPKSTINKYNDFVQAIVDSKTSTLLQDVKDGNTARVKIDQQNLSRFRKDFIPIPTESQCKVPILKK